MLTAAGFIEVRVDVKATSRAFISESIPDRNAGDFVASANITGRKPGR